MFSADPPMMERISLVGEDEKDQVIFQAAACFLSLECMYKIYNNQMNITPCYHPMANRLSHSSGDEKRMRFPA